MRAQISVNFKAPAVPAVKWPKLWRALHDIEMPGGVRDIVISTGQSKPEVFRLYPFLHVELNEPRQWLWRNLNLHVDDVRFRTFLGNYLALTNGTGWPGHRNYIEKKEMLADNPAYDQMRYFGGQCFAGEVVDKRIVIDGKIYTRALKVDGVDIRKPLPTDAELQAMPWKIMTGLNVAPDGHVFRLKPGIEYYAPLFISTDAFVPLDFLEELPEGITELPNPYVIYKPHPEALRALPLGLRTSYQNV